jgi:hypothetical protein
MGKKERDISSIPEFVPNVTPRSCICTYADLELEQHVSFPFFVQHQAVAAPADHMHEFVHVLYGAARA